MDTPGILYYWIGDAYRGEEFQSDQSASTWCALQGWWLSEKWIPQSLLPYGRDRTVARINAQIVSEWKYLFLHVINQSLIITSREVRASDRTSKERVPGKDSARRIETYTAWGMPWRMDYLYLV
jgi:hypothetical protein